MEHGNGNHRLGEAFEPQPAFAATFNAEDYVDEESALTADDLFVTLDTLEKVHANAKRA